MSLLKVRCLKNQIAQLERQIFISLQNVFCLQDHYQNVYNSLLEFLDSLKMIFQVNFFGDQCTIAHSKILQMLELANKLKEILHANIPNCINDKFPNNLSVFHYHNVMPSDKKFQIISSTSFLNTAQINNLESKLLELYKNMILISIQLKVGLTKDFVTEQNCNFQNSLSQYKSHHKEIVEIVAQFSYLIFDRNKKLINEFDEIIKSYNGNIQSKHYELMIKQAQLNHHKLLILEAQNEILENQLKYYSNKSIDKPQNVIQIEIERKQENVNYFIGNHLLQPLKALIDSYKNLESNPDNDKALEEFLSCCQSSDLLRKNFSKNFIEK